MKQQVDGASSHLDQETRRLILTEAANLFLAKGYKGVSMKEVAEAVQVTSAALYYHFPKGKEDLFTTMIQTVFVDEGLAGIEKALATAPDFRGRLTLLTSALLTLPIDERLSMLLRDAREFVKSPEHQRVILALRDRIKQQVTRVFRAARDAGELCTDLPVEALVSLYMGMLREAHSLPKAHPAERLVGVLLDGIGNRTRQSPP